MNGPLAYTSVLTCTRCSLRATCRQPVPFWGPAPNKIAVIGEAPGETEDYRGIPFTGRAGRFLDTAWRKARLPPPTTLNAVSCRPPENRTPTPAEIEVCRVNLEAQLAAIDPQFILCLGKTALQAIRGPKAEIGTWRGKPWVRYANGGAGPKTTYLSTYHPAYILRGGDEKVFYQDLHTFGAILTGWWPEECECGAEAAMFDEEGMPKCSASCQGRICSWCSGKKPAEYRLLVDGKSGFMACKKHVVELKYLRGIEVIGVA